MVGKFFFKYEKKDTFFFKARYHWIKQTGKTLVKILHNQEYLSAKYLCSNRSKTKMLLSEYGE